MIALTSKNEHWSTTRAAAPSPTEPEALARVAHKVINNRTLCARLIGLVRAGNLHRYVCFWRTYPIGVTYADLTGDRDGYTRR
jgi:hypothetical protein